MTIEWQAGRLDSDLDGVGFDTLAVRAGQHRSPEGEHSEAIYPTSSYVFRTAADAAARFAGEVPGNVYSRYTNPTVRAFEERIAALEGAEQAVATSSGMSAILAIVMSLCSAGDHVLVSRSVFGSTISLFEKYLKRFGVQVDYVPLADLDGWAAAFKPNTKLLFVESPSNPLAELVDIAALADIAHSNRLIRIARAERRVIEAPADISLLPLHHRSGAGLGCRDHGHAQASARCRGGVARFCGPFVPRKTTSAIAAHAAPVARHASTACGG